MNGTACRKTLPILLFDSTDIIHKVWKRQVGGNGMTIIDSLKLVKNEFFNQKHPFAKQDRKVEPIAESAPQFRSGSATRPREVGFASNGVSATTP